MALTDNTLKTRIALKYDTYANWTSESLGAGLGANYVLKKGEVGFVEIPSSSSVLKDGNAANLPTVLFKVGDGVTAFKNLKWGSAVAADVYGWAKKQYLEWGDMSEAFKTALKNDANTDHKYTFEEGTDTNGNTYYTVYESVLTNGTWSTPAKVQDIASMLTVQNIGEQVNYITEVVGEVEDLDQLASDVEQAKEDIEALEAKVGKNSVATQITNAINGLDKADSAVAHQFVTAVSEENGIINVSRAQAEIADINGLSAKISDLESADNENSSAITEEVNRAKGAEGDLDTAIKAEAARADAAEKVNAKAISDEVARAEGAEEDLQTAINDEETARKAQIGNLGKVSAEEGAADHTVKSYVDAKIAEVNADNSELEGRVESLETDVATLIDKDTGKSVRQIANEELAAQLIPEDAKESLNTLQEIAAWIQSHPDDAATMNQAIAANTAAIGAEETRAKAAEAANASDINGLKTRMKTAESDIGALEALHAEGKTVAQEVSDGITLLNLSNTYYSKTAGEADAAAIEVLNGDASTDGSVAKAVADEASNRNAAISAAVAALDVTNNVSDAVAGITVKVDEVDGKVSKPVVTVAGNEVIYTAAEGSTHANLTATNVNGVLKGDAIAAIKQYADACELSEKTRAEAAENGLGTRITALEDAVGETDVAGQIKTEIEKLDSTATVATVGADNKVKIKTTVEETDGKIGNGASEITLGVAAYTNAIEDLDQTSVYLFLDCGNAQA